MGGGNVTVFGDVADSFDAQVRWSEQLLDGWVEESGYSVGSMVVASTAKAFMEFSQGFVDMGRFGNGMFIEGGWRGVGKDVLRGINVVGSGGAILGRLGRVLQVAQKGGTCTWQALSNSLRWTGQKYLATIEDLAKAAGLNPSTLENLSRATNILKLQEALTKLGVTFRVLTPVKQTIEGAIDLAAANGNGVVNFSVRLIKAGKEIGGHRLYVSYTKAAGLMIKDSNFPQLIIRSVSALKAHIKTAYVVDDVVLSSSPILFIKDALLVTISHAAQRLTELSQIVLPLAPLIGVPSPSSEVARKAIDISTAGLNGQPVPAVTTHSVVRGDTLSAIALKHYRDGRKWPLIYAANAATIGSNPNLIKVGQSLRIPSATS